MSNNAILLMNLGSPESPDTQGLKPYLTEFLMDERVLDMPTWLRTLLVKGLIVPFRAPKSAEKYKTVWTREGSPLIVHTRNQLQLLKEKISSPVYSCMRYGKPTATETLARIHSENKNLRDLILFPLYPHYAMSSYETAVEDVKAAHLKGGFNSHIRIVPPFYKHPHYINALAELIRPWLNRPFDHILFSYHGIPERHVKKTDPTHHHCLQTAECCDTPSSAHNYCYRHQIITTTRLAALQLGLEAEKFSFSFQSRLGTDSWLKPYTVNQLKEFPQRGIKNLLVVCPAFVSDCLETLEEIEMEGKELFEQSGGEHFTMIPALNENPLWIDCMEKLVSETVPQESAIIS
jgi:ferrochelatase